VNTNIPIDARTKPIFTYTTTIRQINGETNSQSEWANEKPSFESLGKAFDETDPGGRDNRGVENDLRALDMMLRVRID
jgi:hypothetical protein